MIEIESTTYDVAKGSSVTIKILRLGGTTGKVSVTFQTSPGSAVHGRHYEDVTVTLDFESGETSKLVTVQTIKNTEVTGNLTFFGEIVDPTNNAILGFNTSSTITIYPVDNKIASNATFIEPVTQPHTTPATSSFSNKSVIITAAVCGAVVLITIIIVIVLLIKKKTRKTYEAE